MTFSCTPVFDSGTLDGFKGAVNRWFLPVFFSVFRGAGACMVAKVIYKQLCFSNLVLCNALACAAGFNNDYNIWQTGFVYDRPQYLR